MGNCYPCKQELVPASHENQQINNSLKCVSNSLISIKDKKSLMNTALHNSAKVSKQCHVKLSADRGHTTSRPLKCKTFDATHFSKKKMLGQKIIPEKLSEDVDQLETVKLSRAKASLAYSKTSVGEPGAKMVRKLKIDTTSKDGPIISFDLSNLVLENKGQVGDRYKMMEVIGRGGFGEVCKIMHFTTKKVFALKTINKANYEETADIFKEIQVLKSLDHPNIVRLYEFFQDNNNYYLVTEYCAGGELFEKILTMNFFSERVAAKIMKQLLSAVAYCHARHVVHRDLKLENLVLETDDIQSNLKVIDFGTCRIFKPREMMKDITGTAYYIAPEVLRENYNEKCDVWSCGVILYMLLIGEPPFPGTSNEEVLENVSQAKVSYTSPKWSRVSKESIALVKKMLTCNVDSRITAEDALKDIWFVRYKEKQRSESTELLEYVKNLNSFRASSMMQKAVLAFMAAHIMDKEEEKKLREIFTRLDADRNGLLSLEELAEGYLLLFKGDVESAREEARKTMRELDSNNNGTIDYNEFLMANLKRKDCTNEKNLKLAFDFFDENKDGQISVNELQRIFGRFKIDTIRSSIIKGTDTDNDDQISYKEFIEMMGEFVKRQEQKYK